MKLGLLDQIGFAKFELTQIGRGERENVLPLVAFALLQLLDAFLERTAKVNELGKVRQDLGEYNERVSHLQVLVRLETYYECFG